MGTDQNEVIFLSSTDGNETLSLYLAGYELPNVDVNCNLESTAFSQLGLVALSGSVGGCTVTCIRRTCSGNTDSLE